MPDFLLNGGDDFRDVKIWYSKRNLKRDYGLVIDCIKS